MDLTLCTSKHCCYKDKCARQLIEEPDNPYLSFTNFEYTCQENSGFDSFIPIHTERNNK